MAFNWHAAPTFVAMLCFWLLASYVLTRSPRSLLTLLAVAVQLATAAYLLGQGMGANATTLADWQAWTRNLQWGATIAPVLWYSMTVLLLLDQQVAAAQRYARFCAQPLAIVFGVATVCLTVGIYLGDWLYRWSAPLAAGSLTRSYGDLEVQPGPVYPAFMALLAGTTVGALVNVWLTWRSSDDIERRRRFGWLMVSAALFIVGANSLTFALDFALPFWVVWLGHLTLAAAIVIMAANVAAYSLVLDLEVLRADLFSFLTSLIGITLIYAIVFVAMRPAYSFQLLALVMVVLLVTIILFALFDSGRRQLDRLFFQPDVQRLRSNLSVVAQSAAVAPDLDTVLAVAQAEIAEVSAEHMVRLVEEALRRLNSPASLARSALADRLPNTLAVTRPTGSGAPRTEPTPLERAQALRAVLTAAIERLKPADRAASNTPAALQYHILHGEYVLGVPIKQLMLRHNISESTFHRQRREAISVLADELAKREDVLGHRALTGA